jgi:exodeoxyribonuclease VII small subunit
MERENNPLNKGTIFDGIALTLSKKTALKKDTPSPQQYESAWIELQKIVQDLQNESVSIDDLTKQLARANELILFCRERLRQTESEVNKLL